MNEDEKSERSGETKPSFPLTVLQICADLIDKLANPLRFFGIAAILCAGLFPFWATSLGTNSYDAFIYSLHTFLALVGVLALITVFSPMSLYHPKELKNITDARLPPYRPVLAVVSASIVLLIYLAYQWLRYGSHSNSVAP